jgi:hypothetical protein
LQYVSSVRIIAIATATTIVACSASSHYYNALAGPVLGVRLGGAPGSRAVIGLEAGAGWTVERFNLGVDHRAGHTLYYLELDPWLVLGATIGLAVDDVADLHPVLGAWEGVLVAPLVHPADCLDVPDDRRFYPTITLSIGYRYTGEHELYLAPKFGGAQKPVFCE